MVHPGTGSEHYDGGCVWLQPVYFEPASMFTVKGCGSGSRLRHLGVN
jgi:hypothetical protein